MARSLASNSITRSTDSCHPDRTSRAAACRPSCIRCARVPKMTNRPSNAHSNKQFQLWPKFHRTVIRITELRRKMKYASSGWLRSHPAKSVRIEPKQANLKKKNQKYGQRSTLYPPSNLKEIKVASKSRREEECS